MIGRLTGMIEPLSDRQWLLEVGGVGYCVALSAKTAQRVSDLSGAVTLWIESVTREDGTFLFGFLERGEQTAFRQLTGVQGVGPKVALSILSVLAPEALALAIASADKAAISAADGVGPKLAARLLTELKDKFLGLEGVSLSAPSGVSSAPSAMADAVSALIGLGYRRAEAQAAVARAQEKLGADVGAARLITASLQDLAA